MTEVQCQICPTHCHTNNQSSFKVFDDFTAKLDMYESDSWSWFAQHNSHNLSEANSILKQFKQSPVVPNKHPPSPP